MVKPQASRGRAFNREMARRHNHWQLRGLPDWLLRKPKFWDQGYYYQKKIIRDFRRTGLDRRERKWRWLD